MEPMNNDEKDKLIEELKKQVEDNLNGWKRAKADFINLQNDVAKERNEWIKFASVRCLERLLPAMDALLAAAAHLPELDDTVRKFEEYLKGEGVTEIETVGKYDPAIHDVVSKEKKEGASSDIIISVLQKGYKLHDKLLRPAKVVIAE
jgi:molecular chaperone GrpE